MAHYLVSKDVIKSLAFPVPPTPTSGILRRQRRPKITAGIHIEITGQVEEPP